MQIMNLDCLFWAPKPQCIEKKDREFFISFDVYIVCLGDTSVLFPLSRRLQNFVLKYKHKKWKIRALEAKGKQQIVLNLDPELDVQEQGYFLDISSEKILLQAKDGAGIFYGLMTLQQILRQCNRSIPNCIIKDHPDFFTRGVMLDISRDKVPKMETLLALIDKFSEWKINHLQLYTEHTFAYANHEDVWAQSGVLTGEDILFLDSYCRERFIELVPNQNSFGHMHRFLGISKYKHLAECPGGIEHPWGREPFSLAPENPETLKLLEDLYSQLLPHFTSCKFNVGCDETFDLGEGASKELCQKIGKGQVYLNFLHKIHELVKKYNRKMLFWGDIILQHPEFIKKLPKDIVALQWGYDADHPFMSDAEKFSSSGIEFYVCPGTSSWNSIFGKTKNCLENIDNACRAGLKHRASGFLNTDWGDDGHLQYLPISYLGFVAGASLSWAYEENKSNDFVEILNTHIFEDSSKIIGKILYDLGNAYLHTKYPIRNRTALFQLLTKIKDPCFQKLDGQNLKNTLEYIQQTISPLDQSSMRCDDAGLIQQEIRNAAQMGIYACHRGLAFQKQKKSSEQEMASMMRSILGQHRILWCERNQIGGLQDSSSSLESRLLEHLP